MSDLLLDLAAGAGVTLALAATRVYLYGVPGMSPVCLVAGAAAAGSDYIEEGLTSSALGLSESSNPLKAYLSMSDVVVCIAGGLALEASVQGLSLGDLTSLPALQRIGVGAVAAYAGLRVGRMISGTVLVPMLKGNGKEKAKAVKS